MPSASSQSSLVPVEHIGKHIFLIRGQKVMLDRDLAELYGVETFNLNKAVKRNIDRFPDDFLFQLSQKEWENLVFQSGITRRHGGSRYMPFAFTEQGVAMLSSVLHSQRAIQVNIAIMRAFAQLRRYLSTHEQLARKLKELEIKLEGHDEQIASVFEAIRQLVAPPVPENDRKIGFKLD